MLGTWPDQQSNPHAAKLRLQWKCGGITAPVNVIFSVAVIHLPKGVAGHRPNLSRPLAPPPDAAGERWP